MRGKQLRKNKRKQIKGVTAKYFITCFDTCFGKSTKRIKTNDGHSA